MVSSCCAFNLARVKAYVKHFSQKCSENMYFPNFQIWRRGWLKLKKGLKMPNFPAAGTIIHSLQNPHASPTLPSFSPHFPPLFPSPLSLPLIPLKTLVFLIVFSHHAPANLFPHSFQKSFLHFALHCVILYISLK